MSCRINLSFATLINCMSCIQLQWYYVAFCSGFGWKVSVIVTVTLVRSRIGADATKIAPSHIYEVDLYVNYRLWSRADDRPLHQMWITRIQFSICLLLLLSRNDIKLQEQGQAIPSLRWSCLQSLLQSCKVCICNLQSPSTENAVVSHSVWFHLEQREKQKEKLNTMRR